MSAFLRGGLVHLHPTDAPAPHGPRAWLGAGPLREGDDEILMEARLPAGGPPLAVVGLGGVDWVARGARLCAGPLPRGPPPAPVLAEALALVARYAVEELALERLEATPADDATREALAACGFAPGAPGGPWALLAPSRLPPR